MTKDEALRLALEALVMLLDNYVPEATEEDISQVETTISAIKAALEAKDESVAKYSDIISDGGFDPRNQFDVPPQRTWVGLTHAEIDYQAKKDDHGVYFALGALWAEAKLKEKNT